MKNQAPLMPNVSSPTVKARPKDLTDTLLANNLNQLNWSTNKTILPGSTSPNYNLNMSKNAFSPGANSPFGSKTSQQPATMSWNQTVPQNTNTNPMQLSSGWTSPAMMLPTSSSQGQSSAPKLSTEEIMDFLK